MNVRMKRIDAKGKCALVRLRLHIGFVQPGLSDRSWPIAARRDRPLLAQVV